MSYLTLNTRKNKSTKILKPNSTSSLCLTRSLYFLVNAHFFFSFFPFLWNTLWTTQSLTLSILYALLDIFLVVEASNEHFCASLKIECARARALAFHVCTLFVHYNFFFLFFIFFWFNSFRFAIVIISPSQAQIRSLHRCHRLCRWGWWWCCQCCRCCYRQMDEYISIYVWKVI